MGKLDSEQKKQIIQSTVQNVALYAAETLRFYHVMSVGRQYHSILMTDKGHKMSELAETDAAAVLTAVCIVHAGLQKSGIYVHD